MGSPAHPLERAYPCCLPALGEFGNDSAARGIDLNTTTFLGKQNFTE